MNYTSAIFSITLFCLHQLYASTNDMTIINQSSDQITVTVQTNLQTVSQSALPNENHVVNTMNNSVLTSTSLSYTTSPMIKIVINRLSTTLPQIIYYNHEVTVDSKQRPTGIYSINLGKPAVMKVLQDSVIINNQTYNLTDLKSFIIKCNQLNNQLLPTNTDLIQQQLDDIATSLQSMQESDKQNDIGSQMIAVQSQIDLVKNNIKTMVTLHNDMKTVQDLLDNLSTQNLDQTKSTTINIETGLHTIMQSNLQGAIYAQAQALQNNINKLKQALQNSGVSFESLNYEFLIPYSQDYAVNYQQISSKL